MGSFISSIEDSISGVNALLLTATGTEPDIMSTVKMISEFGIMTVSCGVLIIFTIVMFNKFMKTNSSSDAKLAEAVTKSLDTLTVALGNTMNLGEVFDKYNTKSTTEFDKIERDLDAIKESIEQIEKQHEDILKILEHQEILSQIERNS